MLVVSVERLSCTIENEATRGRYSRVETRQFLRLKRVMTSPDSSGKLPSAYGN